MNDMYKQAKLFRADLHGSTETVSWIPSKIAKVGQNVRLKEDNGQWSYWTVESVSETEITRERAIAQERAYLKYAQVTDI